MDRRPTAAGQRRLDNLRQKRNVLRSHSEDAKPLPIARSQQPASGVAPTAAARRRQQVYALTSSSSSSDAEDEPDAVTQVAPSSQELTAKLFAKLGIKGGGGRGGGGGTAGFDSDSSWASSPDRSARIRAVPAAGRDGAAEDKASSLSRASSEATIAALQQELAAARAQADGATQQLRAAESVAHSLQERLQAAEQQQLAGSDAHTSALDGVAPDHWQQAQELAAANSQLRDEVSELGGQLAAAAAWQHEVEALGLQLGGMQAAVAESEAARQEQQAELAELLRQRDRELLGATARLAATEAQLAAAQAAGSGAGMQLRPTGDLLAELGISQAELTAALSEAAALLA